MLKSKMTVAHVHEFDIRTQLVKHVYKLTAHYRNIVNSFHTTGRIWDTYQALSNSQVAGIAVLCKEHKWK